MPLEQDMSGLANSPWGQTGRGLPMPLGETGLDLSMPMRHDRPGLVNAPGARQAWTGLCPGVGQAWPGLWTMKA